MVHAEMDLASTNLVFTFDFPTRIGSDPWSLLVGTILALITDKLPELVELDDELGDETQLQGKLIPPVSTRYFQEEPPFDQEMLEVMNQLPRIHEELLELEQKVFQDSDRIDALMLQADVKFWSSFKNAVSKAGNAIKNTAKSAYSTAKKVV
jgi:hypothetical protein